MITAARRLLATHVPRLVCLLIVSIAGGSVAHAFSLGQVSVRSHAGEALDASVALYVSPQERAARMEVRIDENLFAPRTPALRALLAQLDARVEHQPDGYSVLRIRSRAALTLDRFSFRLRAAAGNVAQSRVYDITLRAAPAPRRSTRPVANARSIGPVPRAQANIPASTIDTTTGTYTVRSGDSLWTIARRLAGNANINATMRALHAANPTAFSGGDIDRLRAGAVLRLPGASTESAHDTATAATDDAAPATGDAQAMATATAATEGAGATDVVSTSQTEDTFAALSQLDADTEAPMAVTGDSPVAATAATAPVIGDPELAARLAALDAKFAAIRAKYGDGAAGTDGLRTDAPVTVVNAGAAPATDATVDEEAVVLPQPGRAETATRESAPKATAAKPRRKTSPAAPSTDSDEIFRTSLLLGGGAALLLLVVLFLRVRHRQSHRRRQLAAHLAREADQRAAVAEKAGRSVAEGDTPKRGPLPGPAVSELEDFDFSTTLDSLDDDTVAAAENPLAQTQDEIDASIAHGRYQDAERLLLKVIDLAPRNVPAKLRLAEVYYITERVQEFVTLAEDLHHHHRADLTGDEWRRVMRMGKIIAPDKPLFSGPRAVSNG